MPIKRAAFDTLEGLAEAIRVNTSGFAGLKDEENPFEKIQEIRNGLEARLARVDEKMSKFLTELGDLTIWANRMRSCRGMFHKLDKNLAFKGKPQWDWDEVLRAAGFIFSVAQGAEETLAENGVDIS